MTAKLERVYVWQLPVRAFHWVNAFCIVVLGVTGFLIGSPVALRSPLEATPSFWFGTVRFVHFATAYLLTFNFLIRIYWAFRGNAYASWRNFLLVTPRQWREVFSVLRVDILQLRSGPLESIGHNALASLTYFASFLVFLVQVLTGFGLYAAMSSAFMPRLFRWIVPLLGGDMAVRQLHHVMLWFFVLFTLVHVYLVAFHDYVEGRGVVSSMVGGWKFVETKAKGPERPAG
jgi:Ni/Fe-hydrogenase 1 B-type cytochrome subunit